MVFVPECELLLTLRPAGPEPRGQSGRTSRLPLFAAALKGMGQMRYIQRSLMAVGGVDLRNRCLLESRLSVFKHLRGNNDTQNELSTPLLLQLTLRMLEYVVPSKKLLKFDEIKVVESGWPATMIEYSR